MWTRVLQLFPLMVLSCLATFAETQPSASQSVVHLKDGEILIGVIKEGKKTITISSALLGTIVLPREQVEQIATVAIDQRQPAEKPMPSDKFVINSVSLGASGAASLMRNQKYTADVNLAKNWHLNSDFNSGQRTLLLLAATYDDKWKAQPLTSNITQVYDGSLQHMIFAPHGFWANPFLIGHAYHNNNLGVRIEQAYGAGVDKRFVEEKINSVFELSADLRAISEELYTPGREVWLSGSNVQLAYSTIPKSPTQASFSITVAAVPVFNRGSAWQANGAAGLDIPIGATKFFIDLTVVNNYYAIAPHGFNKNYFSPNLTIKYSPGK